MTKARPPRYMSSSPKMFQRLDDFLFHHLFAGGTNATLTFIAVLFSAIGEGWAIFAIFPLFALPRMRRFAGWLTCTLAGAGVLVFAIKAVVRRGRPFTDYPSLHRVLLDSPTDFSFPSGHATGSFTFALFMAHALLGARPRPRFARTIATAIILTAACVGVSRVVLGFHFPLDVLAGTVLGATIGAISGRAFTTRGTSSGAESGDPLPSPSTLQKGKKRPV